MIGVMLFTRQNFSFATMYQNQNGKEQRKMNKGITNIKSVSRLLKPSKTAHCE
jgi:hypothetical protein